MTLENPGLGFGQAQILWRG